MRVVAIADDEQPGREKTIYSDIVKVQYGFGKPVTIIAPPVPRSLAQKDGRLIFLEPRTEYTYHYNDSFNGYGRLMKMPVNKDW